MDLNKIAQANFGYAVVLTGNCEDAKDLLQDTNLKILLAKRKPDCEEEMGYFYKVAMKRMCVSYYRKNKVRRDFLTEYDRQLFTEPAAYLKLEVKDAYACMKLLTPYQAQALRLHVEGYKDAEICPLMGHTRLNNITGFIHHGKKKMRALRHEYNS